MRAIADQRETVCEFRLKRRTYRLILPTGRHTFELERLTREEWRRWIGRWSPYAVGTYRDMTVISGIRGIGRPLPAAVLAAIAAALAYVVNGPTTRRTFNA